MIDIKVKCQKISDYLSSFLVEGDKNTSFKNSSDADVLKFPALKLSLNGNNESQEANIKTNTVPNNIEEFHRRLKSFECGLWTCTAISPLLCATYGWKLIKKDILSCVTCKALICTTLPLPNQTEAYKVFSVRLKERLKTGHKDWCEWPNNPSPPEYLHPPLHMTVHYANSLAKKANNLLTLGNRIPYVNCEEILRKLGLEIKEVYSFFNIHPELSENHINAAALALCGWGCGSKEKIQCSLCFRSIGLWNFLPLSESSNYLELEKKNEEKKEKQKAVEDKKQQRDRRLLIKEEKLKAKLLEEKKAALAEMEAKERALKVKLTLEEISKLENSDLSNPSDDCEAEEEMGEEEENLLLNEDGSNELIMEEENDHIVSEPDFTSFRSVGTSTENNELNVENDSIPEYIPEDENKEVLGSKTCEEMLDTESEGNLESGECSKSGDGNESDDLWLEAVGGYNEENENRSKPMYSPSSGQSENSIDYPTDNTNRKRENNESSEEENCIDYSRDSTNNKRYKVETSEDGNSRGYPSNKTSCERQDNESSEDDNSRGYPSYNTSRDRHSNESSDDESTIEYTTDNVNRKRRRSASSENENSIDFSNANLKRHRSESPEDENSIEYPTYSTNRKRNNSGSSEGENSIDYPIGNISRKRRRSEGSENEYLEEEESAAKFRRVGEVCESQFQSNGNEDTPFNERMEKANSCDVTENEVLPTEAQDINPENVEEEEMDEEEIEEIEENPEEIAVLNKMRNSLFQPLEQHRHWCGWVVRHSSLYIDNDETGIEGFKIIPPQISHFQPDLPHSSIVTSEKYAGNIVGLRTVRGILDSWARDQDEDLQEL